MLIGIYARYSTADQSETSIADQIRRCRNTIAHKKITATREIIFQDAAISGSANAQPARSGYADLLNAIENQQLNCLVVDEISRLSRDPSEIIRITEFIEKLNILLLSSDGIDSREPDWQMRLALAGIIGKAELDNIRYQTKRGLQGQLERGYMIAHPAFGYTRIRVNAAGLPAVNEEEATGTIWEVNEAQATIVRRIYEQRASGKAFGDIARELNDKKILPPRADKNGKSVWLPTTVHRLITNPIYRGVFVLHGSVSYRATHKSRADEPTEYNRPSLRLVSDEVWTKCNPASSGPGTKKRNSHFLSRLVTCGLCGRYLSMTSASHNCRSLYCSACSARKKVSSDEHSQTTSVSLNAVKALIRQVLLFTISNPEVFSAYQNALNCKLTNTSRDRLSQVRKKLRTLAKDYQNTLDQYIAGNDTLESQVALLGLRQQALKTEKDLLEHQLRSLDEESIQHQLSITPSDLIDTLMEDSKVYEDRLYPILKTIFPSIRLMGRRSDKAAVFEVQIDLGQAVAAASGTATVVAHPITTTYAVLASKRQPGVWTVTPSIPPKATT